jgi:hypothetical protein
VHMRFRYVKLQRRELFGDPDVDGRKDKVVFARIKRVEV